MNINLRDAQPSADLLGRIAASADELARHSDTRPVGPPILIPEGPAYPGSYRVWFPTAMEGHATGFIWIDPDGIAHALTLAAFPRWPA